MKTTVYTKEDLFRSDVRNHIKETLINGKNVIFPTETVYGIGAYALSEKGVSGIYAVKGRPSDNPLIMHLSDQSQVYPYVKNIKPYVQELMDIFWPGPLTLVFEKSTIVPLNITGGLDTVGIRVPSNDIAKEVIEIAGVPICAPSANISGRPSSTLPNHVLDDFNGRVDIIIDGGKSEIGLESTVLDVTRDTPVILRPGMVTKQMLSNVVGEVLLSGEIKKDDIPKAPGMKYKHYAPKGKLTIIEGAEEKVVEFINNQVKLHNQDNKRVGLIVTKSLANKVTSDYVFVIGEDSNEVEIASNLFASLREMDTKDIDYIYSLSFHEGRYAEAIMNRLYKAANKSVVKL